MLHLANALTLALASAAAVAAPAAPTPPPATTPATICTIATIRPAAPAKRIQLTLPDWTRNLTVEQQNEAQQAEDAIEFNINHSP